MHTMTEPIRWTSPLIVSLVLFLAIGVLWLLIGLLAVPLHKRANPDYLFVSTPTDTAYFGGIPSELAPPGSALAKLRTLLLTVISGLLVVAGVLVGSVAGV